MKYRTTDSNQAFLAEEKPVFLHLNILNVSSTVLSYVWAGQWPLDSWLTLIGSGPLYNKPGQL